MYVWTYWKCNYCNSIIRGDADRCPRCGGGLQSGQKYMMPDNPEVIKAINSGEVLTGKQQVVKDAIEVVSKDDERFGANWICGYCGYQNLRDNPTCKGCGSSKIGAQRDYFDDEPNIAPCDTTEPKAIKPKASKNFTVIYSKDTTESDKHTDQPNEQSVDKSVKSRISTFLGKHTAHILQSALLVLVIGIIILIHAYRKNE